MARSLVRGRVIMTLKLLHIAPFFQGGVGIVAYNLTKELIKMGVDVTLASPTSPPVELVKSGIVYYSLKKPLLKDPFYATEFYILNIGIIKDLMDREKPDVILTHGPLAIIARAIRAIPIISIVHGTYANEVKWMYNHPIFGIERVKYIASIYTTYKFDASLYSLLTRSRSVYLVAVSKNTRKELIEAGAMPGKVFSILNGVDKDVFKPMNKDYAKTQVEEIFEVRLRDKVLLHVNPGPIKGTHILIKAIAMLRRIYGDNFTLLIVGKLGPKTYREYVENMIRCLKLEENIKILGYVEHKLLPLLYNTADVTIVPSYSEGGPLTTPESLACGTPVIATNVGGNPEYLSIVGLNTLLVTLTKYDFSVELAHILLTYLNSVLCIIRERIPSWQLIAQEYLKFSKSLKVGKVQ
jgi:glycosyltransferase involved in cell wall biosynthesis